MLNKPSVVEIPENLVWPTQLSGVHFMELVKKLFRDGPFEYRYLVLSRDEVHLAFNRVAEVLVAEANVSDHPCFETDTLHLEEETCVLVGGEEPASNFVVIYFPEDVLLRGCLGPVEAEEVVGVEH